MIYCKLGILRLMFRSQRRFDKHLTRQNKVFDQDGTIFHCSNDFNRIEDRVFSDLLCFRPITRKRAENKIWAKHGQKRLI